MDGLRRRDSMRGFEMASTLPRQQFPCGMKCSNAPESAFSPPPSREEAEQKQVGEREWCDFNTSRSSARRTRGSSWLLV